jgi:hypothetical protein
MRLGTMRPSLMMPPTRAPRADPDATSARSRSPADTWSRPKRSASIAHCVPLPDPAFPRTKYTLRPADMRTRARVEHAARDARRQVDGSGAGAQNAGRRAGIRAS